VFVEGSVAGITTAAVNDSVLSSNSFGLDAYGGTAGATARWTAIRTTASHNNFGFRCDSGSGTALCTVGYSMANGNAYYGFYQIGTATFRSLGNNIVIDNTTDTVGTITPLAGT
jgi:hypothetical protein